MNTFVEFLQLSTEISLWVFAGIMLTWRLLRLVAFVQQKEYRLDRWLLFWRSAEGRRERLHLAPTVSELKTLGVRRPRLTARAALVMITAAALLLILLLSVFWLGMQFGNGAVAIWLLGLTVIQLLLPVVVLFSLAPSVLISRLIVYNTLWRAQRLVRRHSPIIIGITGSYGKTAAKQVLAAVLATSQEVFVTPRSHNTLISVARSILALYKGEKIMVVEYAAYTKGEIAQLARWFQPTIAVITGLTEQHLGLFGSLDAIVTAKSELVKALPHQGKAWHNNDDSGAQRIVAAAGRTDLRIFSYSAATLSPTLDEKGSLNISIAGTRVSTALVGTQYAAAVAAAVSISQNLGSPIADVVNGISKFEPSDTFITRKYLRSGTVVIDDGGSCNPTGFLAALELINSLSAQRRVLLFSGVVDLAEQEVPVHERLAHAAVGCDEVWYVGSAGQQVFCKLLGKKCIVDRAEIAERISLLSQGTVLLIEGRMPSWVESILSKNAP